MEGVLETIHVAYYLIWLLIDISGGRVHRTQPIDRLSLGHLPLIKRNSPRCTTPDRLYKK